MNIETSFDAETLFVPQDTPKSLPHLMLDGFIVKAKTQICQEFAPIFFDFFE